MPKVKILGDTQIDISQKHKTVLHIQFLGWLLAVYSIFVIYFSQITGSFTLAMSLGAIHNITTTCLEVPTGILSDKFKRKTVTLLGSVSVFIAACLYAPSPTTTLSLFSQVSFLAFTMP